MLEDLAFSNSVSSKLIFIISLFFGNKNLKATKHLIKLPYQSILETGVSFCVG
jgi:hypothetical protein